MNCIFHQVVEPQAKPLLSPDGEGTRNKEKHVFGFENVQLGQRKKVNRRNQGWQSARDSTKSLGGLLWWTKREHDCEKSG